MHIRDWRLQRAASGAYAATVQSNEFALRLAFTPTQPTLLQGQGGFSQKGPAPENASYYYSKPHLKVQGEITVRSRRARG